MAHLERLYWTFLFMTYRGHVHVMERGPSLSFTKKVKLSKSQSSCMCNYMKRKVESNSEKGCIIKHTMHIIIYLELNFQKLISSPFQN